MRNRIFKTIEPADDRSTLGKIYDFVMMAAIVISLVPLAFKESHPVFVWIEYVCVGLFALDYLLRLLTADLKLKKSVFSFFWYPLTPMAVIDLLAVLPTFLMLNSSWRVLKVVRLMRTLRVLRTFKFLRYSKSFDIIVNVFRRQKRVLSAVCSLAVAYVLVSALVIYNVEPESFHTFFDAVYWATVSLTTVGYGDIYPVTLIGRSVAMVSSAFGIAIIALPAGVITAGYIEEIRDDKDSDRDPRD